MKKILLFLLLAVNLTAFSQAPFSSQGIYLASNLDSVRVAGILKSGSVWVNRTFWAIDIVKNRLKISDTANMLLPYATKQYVINTTYTQAQVNTLLAGKEPTITAGTTGQYYRGDKTWQALNAAAVGLGNVPNVNTTVAANITQDATHRFVRDDQITTWNAGGGSVVNGNLPVLVATQLGLDSSGTVNNKIRLQTIIDSIGPLGGGDIIFPKGTYKFWNTVTPTWYFDNNTTVTATNQVTRIFIKYSNVHLIGQDPTSTIFKFLGTNGVDPQTHWDLITDASINASPNNAAVRSPGIMIRPKNSGDKVTGFWLKNITMDGGCSFTGQHFYPADPTTGDGWDISHKGLFFYDDGVSGEDNTIVENDIFKNWRGEEIWSGNGNVGRIKIEGSQFMNCNGSEVSMGGSQYIKNNRFTRGVNGIESYPGPNTTCDISGNEFYDIHTADGTDGNGMVWGGATTELLDSMNADIHDNFFKRCAKSGMLIIRRPRSANIHDNLAEDCNMGFRLEPLDGTLSDIVFQNNIAQATHTTVVAGFAALGNGQYMKNIEFKGNISRVTQKGDSLGVNMNNGFYFYNTSGNIKVHDNTFFGSQYAYVNAGASSGIVQFPICYNNRFEGPSSYSTFTITVSSGSFQVDPLERVQLANSPDVSATIDITFPTSKVGAGTKIRFRNPNVNTKFRFNTGGDYQLTTAITLSQGDWIDLEYNGSKYEVRNSSTKW